MIFFKWLSVIVKVGWIFGAFSEVHPQTQCELGIGAKFRLWDDTVGYGIKVGDYGWTDTNKNCDLYYNTATSVYQESVEVEWIVNKVGNTYLDGHLVLVDQPNILFEV